MKMFVGLVFHFQETNICHTFEQSSARITYGQFHSSIMVIVVWWQVIMLSLFGAACLLKVIG